ncbi:hypothetical protein EDC22_1149 [Tepidamorphus gemmatus]|uniref:Uncharacterized protein n=1 Tax=Tepidamorphus gemmatus TaxID=747076 RepID=A0A4R3M1D5_9HYPH|nr:hypothetical protein EDC22_1149 [Tepidamorphus gemmatus]
MERRSTAWPLVQLQLAIEMISVPVSDRIVPAVP